MKTIWTLIVFFLLSLPFSAAADAFSLHARDADVRELLRSIAGVSGINLVMDDSIKGNVSVALEDVPPEEAIRYITLARGFSVTQEGQTMIISSPQAIENGFAAVHVFPLKYANPDDMVSAVQLFQRNTGQDASKVSSEKSEKSGINRIWSDPGTSSLLFYGTASSAKEIGRLINQLDVPAKQVALEAKIVSVEKEAARKLGASWSWSTVGRPFEFYYAALVEGLISDGKAEVLSRPNITTVQGREAIINIGGEVPVPAVSVTNSTTTTSMEYRQTGIILRYTPYVNEEGYITARVNTEVSSPQYVDDLKAYRFYKRSAETMVRLKDGETMVIGGLIDSEESEHLSKVPFLSELPLLGSFFKSIHKTKKDSEIMIFLTAKLLE